MAISDKALELASERLTANDLVQATLKRGGAKDPVRLTFRPVEIKGARMVQISTFDGKKTDVKNYSDAALVPVVESILATPFRSIFVSSSGEETQIQFTKKGDPLVTRKRRTKPVEPVLKHDRTIYRPLPDGQPDPFLQTIGMMTADGRIKADRQRKFQQINEFIRLVTETTDLHKLSENPLLIVDFGCGNAYLTFALQYYLNSKVGLPTELIGVDRNPDLMARNMAKALELGADSIRFAVNGISDFEAPRNADIVVALHACDTATDQALAQALRYGAKLIFSAPCCHHNLQVQMAAGKPADSYAPIMRDGILRERLGDIVTDTLRAMILRIAGYKVDVIEFAAPEHTAKNLMIRAQKTPSVDLPTLVREYRTLKAAFGVTPHLETLVDDELRSLL